MADVDFTGWGHSYDEVLAHLADLGVNAPPRAADINDIFTTPGRDAINEGAGPIGEALIGLASGGVAGLAKGALESGVLSDVSGQLGAGRAAQMGVTTSTDEAAAAADNVLAPSEEDSAAVSAGIKWGVAGNVGIGTFAEGLPGDHN